MKIDKSILPEVCDSNSMFGETAQHSFFGSQVPITGILGDQQAALFGHLCLTEGEVKNTYGTGCFMLMNTGNKLVKSDKGLLSTIAYSLDGVVTYALEGSVFISGSAVQWLRDGLEFFQESQESEALALSVNDSFGVVFVPSFVGLGTPYWESECKGAIFGLTRATNKAHITRATLESLAYQTKDIIEVMIEESGMNIKYLKVDGGASMNGFLMQFQSDMLNTEIKRPTINETTALGAAYISGLKSGLYKDLETLRELKKTSHHYLPTMSKEEIGKFYSTWKKAINATITFK